MAKAWFGGGRGANNAAGASAVRYIRMDGSCNVETTAAAAYLTWVAGAGKLRRLGLLMGSNGRSTTTTFAFYLNGAAGNQTFTVGAGATGYFYDATSAFDAIANGDSFCLRQTNGTGTGTTNTWAVFMEFEADDGTTQNVVYWENSTSGITNTGSIFPGVQGYAPGTGLEARQTVPVGAPGTYSKLRGIPRTNSYTLATALLYMRKNSGDGNLNVSWAAGVTTAASDNANSDHFNVGDTINWNLRGNSGGGSGTFVIDGIAAAFLADGSATELGGNYGGTGTTLSTAADSYFVIGGSRDQSAATDAAVAVVAPFDMYISRLRAAFNGVATTSAFGPTLMVNGVASALAASFPTGTANATCADNTNAVFVAAGDTVSIRMTPGSAASRNLSYLYVVIDTSPPVAVLTSPLTFSSRPRRPQRSVRAFDPAPGAFFTLYQPPRQIVLGPRARRRHPRDFGPLPVLLADSVLYAPPFQLDDRRGRVERRHRSAMEAGDRPLIVSTRRRPFIYVQT